MIQITNYLKSLDLFNSYLDLLPVTETLMDILPADTLDSEVRKLCSHLLIVHINSADSLLTALSPNL